MTAISDEWRNLVASGRARGLAPGSRSRLNIWSVETESSTVLHEDAGALLEAPNWTHDGRSLILNGGGHLLRFGIVDRGLETLPLTDLPPVNNDHVLAPDNERIFASAFEGHIWECPLAGGRCRRVSRPDRGHPVEYFVHGVSPTGEQLAVVRYLPRALGGPATDVGIMEVATGDYRALTDGSAPADGCEFSPDGSWLYVNTEQYGGARGHSQIARMPAEGGVLERLTGGSRVEWFPHVSPDGDAVVYTSYEPGTVGHPPDRPIQLRLVRGADWARPTVLAAIVGGQGTMNVNSWDPTSRSFAYIDYPRSDVPSRDSNRRS